MTLRADDFGVCRGWASSGFDAFFANGEVDFRKVRMMLIGFAKDNRTQILKENITNGHFERNQTTYFKNQYGAR